MVLGLLLVGSAIPRWTGAQSDGSRLDLVLLIDSTGSTADTDRDNLRLAAAKFLLDYVQSVGEVQGVTHRFAAANFNTATLDEIPWTSLQGNVGRNQLVARSIGNTDFGPALKYALQLRQQPGGAEKMAVVLFTDGAPCPSGPPCPQGTTLDAYFQGLESTVAELQESGAQVFVVALGDNTTATQWSNLVGADHYRFVDANTDLAGVYHDFLAELLGLGAEAARPLADGGVTEITVEPYLEQLVISVVKSNPRAQVTITNPFDGVVMPTRGGADELHAVYAVPSPTAGTWRVRVSGSTAQVWVDRQYATLILDAPTAPQALGTPVEVTGQLLRRGVAIVDDSDLQLSVVTTGPADAMAAFDLTRKPNGRYHGALTDLTAEGVYTLTLSGVWSGQTVGARQTEVVTVSLFAMPVLGLLEIQGEVLVGRPITVTVGIADAERIGPATEVFARLLRADGSTVETPALRDNGQGPDAVAGDGVFAAELILPATEGRYRVEAVLQGISRDGVALDMVTPQQILEVRSSLPTPTVTPTIVTPPRPAGFDVPDLGRRYPWLMIGLVGGAVLASGYLRYRVLDERARADAERARADAAGNTFIREAEEWYRKGEEHSGRGEYEEAREAFAQYFEILRQGFKKLNLDIMPNLSQAAAGLFGALKHLPDDKRDETLLAQAQLQLTTDLDRVRFTAMANALPDLWQPEQAIGKLYILLKGGGQCKPLLDAIAAAGHPPLAAIAQTLQQAIDISAPEVLHRVVADARQLPANSGTGLGAIYEWLESLAQYAEPPRLPADRVKPILDALQQAGPQECFKLVEVAAQQLTAAPKRKPNEKEADYWQRVHEYLQNGLAAIKSQANGQLPEAQILSKFADRWLVYTHKQLQRFMSPPEIHVDLMPALSQVEREEHLKEGYWQVAVPVNLFNAGERPALSVEVRVSVNYGRLVSMPNSVQYLSALAAGRAEHLTFRVEAADGADCRLQIDVTYIDEEPEVARYEFKRTQKSCNPQYLEIAPPASFVLPAPRSNPYTTGPLLNDADWERMAKGGAHETVRQIAAKLEVLQTAGCFVHIVGLRRTGKTTILKRVLRAAQDLKQPSGAPKFLCIYLDLEKWLERIEPYRSPETMVWDSALWYGVLEEIYQVCEHDLPGALRDRIRHVLQSNAKSLSVLPIKDFRGFLREVQRATNRTLFLALDEGEALADLQPALNYQGTGRDLPSSNPITRIMSELQALVEDERVVVLMARGYNEAVWEQNGAHDPRKHTSGCFDIWHTQLLSRDETLELLKMGGFQVTALGQETFWQLTGGYPLLIQVLGDHLYKKRALGELSGTVSNDVIKRAIFDLMTTSAGAEALDFMRYGFKREEEMVLKILAVWFTDLTGYLDIPRGADNYGREVFSLLGQQLCNRWPTTWPSIPDPSRLKQILARMVDKSLLQPPDTGKFIRLRWRVGWVCLFMREVFLEDDEEVPGAAENAVCLEAMR